MEQRVKVRLNEGETESVHIGRGVTQGCSLSPILFNIYAKFLTIEALEERGNFKVGGITIKTIKYVDDQILIACNERELQDMINGLVETGKLYGMEISMEKSKVMRISKDPKKLTIQIEGETLEQVGHFKYLTLQTK